MITITTKAHSGQYRNDGKVPYVQHCLNVAEVLTNVLKQNNETPPKQKLETLQLIGLGHDLFEDTSVGPREISQQFSNEISEGIDSLSNYDGDDNTKNYLKKIKDSSDETKLIKTADLVDNTLSVYYGLHDLGVSWVSSFYLPIAKATDRTLRNSSNDAYPKSYESLLDTHQIWLKMLIQRAEQPREQELFTKK